MKLVEARKLLSGEVVGQRHNGLFFEGIVLEKDGNTVVIETDEGGREMIALEDIKWLVSAYRHC